MTDFQTESLPQETFLLVAVNLLNTSFIDSNRTDARKLYKQLVAGEVVPLTTIQLTDGSTVRFSLSLAYSEFQGDLSYGALRASIVALIQRLSEAVREERELRVFNAQGGGNAMIFGATAVTLEKEKPNVMVLAADLGRQDGATVLQLMYLDPAQFASNQTPATQA